MQSHSRIQFLLEGSTAQPDHNPHHNLSNPTRNRLQRRLMEVPPPPPTSRLPYAQVMQDKDNETSYEVSSEHMEGLQKMITLMTIDFNMTAGGSCLDPVTRNLFSNPECYTSGLPEWDSSTQLEVAGCHNTTSLPPGLSESLSSVCGTKPDGSYFIPLIAGIVIFTTCCALGCWLGFLRSNRRDSNYSHLLNNANAVPHAEEEEHKVIVLEHVEGAVVDGHQEAKSEFETSMDELGRPRGSR
jgi:hypothetical protein